MEFRKIQFTGRSSYIVSLPKAWIREHGLKQGDLVSLVFNPDGSITIFPGKPKEEEETKTIEITEKMSDEEIAENIEAVLNAIIGKLERGESQVKSVYVKTTMGPAVKIEG